MADRLWISPPDPSSNKLRKYKLREITARMAGVAGAVSVGWPD